MDPNANLVEQRLILKRIEVTSSEEWPDQTELAGMAMRLAELVEALDGWLSGGGFLPAAWGRS